MSVRGIRTRNRRMHRKFYGKLRMVPHLGSANGGETIQMWEDRASRWAIFKFFRSLAMSHFRIVQAADDALAPEIPKDAWLGVDPKVHVFQGNAYYITEKLPQHRVEGQEDGVSIVRIEKTASGYTYRYAHDDCIKMPDLSGVTILGHIMAKCVNNGFHPKASKL